VLFGLGFGLFFFLFFFFFFFFFFLWGGGGLGFFFFVCFFGFLVFFWGGLRVSFLGGCFLVLVFFRGCLFWWGGLFSLGGRRGLNWICRAWSPVSSFAGAPFIFQAPPTGPISDRALVPFLTDHGIFEIPFFRILVVGWSFWLSCR